MEKLIFWLSMNGTKIARLEFGQFPAAWLFSPWFAPLYTAEPPAPASIESGIIVTNGLTTGAGQIIARSFRLYP
ncbi:MAG TPA: hypothetical protein VNG51_19430 [Ktedonobacteraceae bacterium]|nr:hypothetical protein [Ktedonobacteraceae bacterium]